MPATTNILKQAMELFRQDQREQLFRAVVTGTSGDLVTIQRTGYSTPDTQSYPRLASYSAPQVNDEVIVARVGKGYVVLGEVLR